jgi:hypothetical protein
MIKFAAFLFAIAAIAPAQSARVLKRGDVKQVILNQPYNSGLQPMWSGRALLVLIVNESREPVVDVVTSDGLTEEVRFSMPEWGKLRLVSLWGGDDGEIVAAGSGPNDKGEGQSFVVRIGADRTKRTYIPVENLNIYAMTVGPSGVIWAIGSAKDKETDQRRNNVLTRFSPTGKVLTSKMLKFPSNPYGVDDVTNPSQMRASADRVAWLTSRNDYIEFATDGSEMLRIAGPGGLESDGRWAEVFDISAANTVLISKLAKQERNKPPTLEIWTLDRIKRTWILSEPAEGAFPTTTSIYGFDGDTIMTSGFDRTLGRVFVRYTLSETK